LRIPIDLASMTDNVSRHGVFRVIEPSAGRNIGQADCQAGS